MTREVFGMGAVVAKAKDAETAVIGDLKQAFAGTATGSTGAR